MAKLNLLEPGIEISGPCSVTRMFINALNPGPEGERAEGDLDFRGTLAVDKQAPVGFTAIRLAFEVETDASAEQLATLEKLTERYCVVWQSLQHPPEGSVTITAA